MNWEVFKSLLLTALIVLSLLLTWNLWNYHSGEQTSENTDYVNSSVSDNATASRSLNQVVRPVQAVFHHDEKHLGIVSKSDLTEMFVGVTEADYKRVRSTKKNIIKKQASQLASNSIELVFPKAIPVSLFADMVQKSAHDQAEGEVGFTNLAPDLMFDRIAFYKMNKGSANMKAFFKNRGLPVAAADVNGMSFDDLDHYQNNHTVQLVRQRLDDGQIIYVPKNKVEIRKVSYTKNWIPVQKFKVALFDNPSNVFNGGDYFSNGVNQLKESDHVIKYINADSGSEQPINIITNNEIIQQSFGYVNGHSGWTDSYVLYNYSQDTNERGDPVRGDVIFRLTLEHDGRSYPVFSDYQDYPYLDAGTIVLQWQNGNVHEYTRTLLDLEYDITSQTTEGKQSLLPSGKEIIKKLKNNENVKWKKVRDFHVGYAMNYPPSSAVWFTPKWFVLYGDKDHATWEKIEDLTAPKEEDPMNRRMNQATGRRHLHELEPDETDFYYHVSHP